MPERILMYLAFFKTIDWKVLVGSVTVAIVVPYFDLILRFCVPIASGIVWIFLKPNILIWKEKYNRGKIKSIARNIFYKIKKK